MQERHRVRPARPVSRRFDDRPTHRPLTAIPTHGRPRSRSVAQELRRYRFGPLERRGVIGSLRPAQVFAITAALVTAVLLMRAAGSVGIGVALILVLAAAVFCFW